MADRYVWSAAAGSGTGATWVNAHTTLTAAITASTAGDRFFVAHDHAESTGGAVSLVFKGTAASPDVVLCANRAGSVPPVSADLRATAAVATTLTNALAIQSGYVFIYGLIFTAGSGGTGANLVVMGATGGFITFKNCALVLGNSGTTQIALGASAAIAQQVILDNTTLQFGATNQSLALAGGRVVWRGTASAIVGANLPTTLMLNPVTPRSWNMTYEGIDLSALGSGKTLVGAITVGSTVLFKDCKLGASVTVATVPAFPGATVTDLVRCDSGDTNYRTERYRYEGTQTTETTIVRTGGASDGTTLFAWKIVTTANSERYLPFECLPISIWNETVGSAITLTVQGIWGGGAVPTNADIWMDVEYLGTSGFPLGSIVTSGPADQLAAGTNLPAGSGTWGGSTTKFALTMSITAQEKGPITVYVKAAAASQTFYIDPLITVT